MLIKRIFGVVAVVVGLVAPALARTQYLYDDLGRLWVVNYDNGTQITYSYDAAGNRSQVVTQSGSILPPTANPDYVSVSENTPITTTPLSNDTDPNVPALSLTISAIKKTPASGTTSIVNSGANVKYTPTTGFSGNDSFVYQITNGTYTSSATVYVSVVGCPQPPNAANDNISTKHGIIDSFDPRTNDSDSCGYALTITNVTQPGNGGSVSIIGSGTQLKYTPPSNWNGTETFTYTVSDGHGQTGSATVTATDTGVDTAPVAANDNLLINIIPVTMPNGGCQPTSVTPTGTLSPMANDSDPDGDAISIVNVGAPSKGTATNNGDGTVTYTYGQTVTQNLNTTDNFSYEITDGYGLYTSAIVAVIIHAQLCQ